MPKHTKRVKMSLICYTNPKWFRHALNKVFIEALNNKDFVKYCHTKNIQLPKKYPPYTYTKSKATISAIYESFLWNKSPKTTLAQFV